MLLYSESKGKVTKKSLIILFLYHSRTAVLESSGTIFREFCSPKDIYLLGIQARYYIKFAEKLQE